MSLIDALSEYDSDSDVEFIDNKDPDREHWDPIKRIKARKSHNARMIRLHIELRRARHHIKFDDRKSVTVASMRRRDNLARLKEYQQQCIKKHARFVGKFVCAMTTWYDDEITTSPPNGQAYQKAAKRFKHMSKETCEK